jgi:Na+-translocating ferredoxin:NAD+ oxidoreductase subunit G
MKDIFRLALVLTLIAAGAGLILSLVEALTREPIAEQRRLETLRALQVVLPDFDNAPDQDVVSLIVDFDRRGQPVERTFYRGRQEEELSGVAFVVSAPDGYSGRIDVMVGVLPGGEVHAVAILRHAETPGLGDKIEEDWFRRQFVGKTLQGANWRVKMDGGEFDQITGATISARAVVTAVRDGLEFFKKERAKIIAAPQPQGEST